MAGGAISMGAAVVIGLILARVGGLRLQVDLRRGRRHLAVVPRSCGTTASTEKDLAPAA